MLALTLKKPHIAQHERTPDPRAPEGWRTPGGIQPRGGAAACKTPGTTLPEAQKFVENQIKGEDLFDFYAVLRKAALSDGSRKRARS